MGPADSGARRSTNLNKTRNWVWFRSQLEKLLGILNFGLKISEKSQMQQF